MNDNILLGFLVSIIIGIIGIIPSCILRFGFKVKFGRKKAAFVMIPIALFSIGLLTCLFYAFGFKIKSFSLISLSIICLGTCQIICKEYDFEHFFLIKKNENHLTPDVVNSNDEGLKNHSASTKDNEIKVENTEEKKQTSFNINKILIVLLLMNFLFSVFTFLNLSSRLNDIEASEKNFRNNYYEQKKFNRKQIYYIEQRLYEVGIISVPPLKPFDE